HSGRVFLVLRRTHRQTGHEHAGGRDRRRGREKAGEHFGLQHVAEHREGDDESAAREGTHEQQDDFFHAALRLAFRRTSERTAASSLLSRAGIRETAVLSAASNRPSRYGSITTG